MEALGFKQSISPFVYAGFSVILRGAFTCPRVEVHSVLAGYFLSSTITTPYKHVTVRGVTVEAVT